MSKWVNSTDTPKKLKYARRPMGKQLGKEYARLSQKIVKQKASLITNIYGLPATEALFWNFEDGPGTGTNKTSAQEALK